VLTTTESADDSSSTDEDINGDAITAYDSISREEDFSDPNPLPFKALIWAYDVPHNAFGGAGSLVVPTLSPLTTEEYANKGRLIMQEYVTRFLLWSVLGKDVALNHSFFTGEMIPANIVSQPNLWSYIEPMFEELEERPIILNEFSVANVGTMPSSRMIVDTFPMGQLFATDFDPAQFGVGFQADLILGANANIRHETEMLLVEWGDVIPGGELSWELDGGVDVDLSEFSILSLRIGQRVILANPNADETTCFNDPNLPVSQSISVIFSLVDGDGTIAPASSGPLIQQHIQHLPKPPAVTDPCESTQFLHTLRIPLRTFCETVDFDVAAVRELRIALPDSLHEVGLFIDSIELTNAPLDEAGRCP
jgi:hypothetical protein